MRKIFLLVLSLALGISCDGKESQYKDIDGLFATVEKKKTEKTTFRSDELVEPIYQVCAGRYLLVGNFFTDPMITVYDLETQKPVKGILSKGKARNEILQIGSLSLCGGQLICYSTNDMKVATIDTTQLSADVPLIRTRQLGETKGLHSLRFCPIQGGRYVTTGILGEADNHFYLLDSTLSLVSGFDTYPDAESGHQMNPTEKALGYQGRLAAAPDGEHLVFSSANGCVLKFFDCTGRLPVKIQEYAIEIPRFSGTPDHTSVRPDRKNSQGVLSTTADTANFYLLYSHKKNTDRKRESKTIYVFDHGGTPIRKLELDVPVTEIVYSDYDNSLYAFQTNEESEPGLRKVSLND